jgi:hypothetical protein
MKWRVRFMRKAGRRIPWKILINEPGHVVTMAADVYSTGGNAERAIQTANKVCYPKNVDTAALALVHHHHSRP